MFALTAHVSSSFEENFKFSQRTKWVRIESVVVMKLLQHRTQNGMFGHPTENTSVLVSSKSRFLDDEAYCSVVTRKSFLSQVLKDMRRATEITCFVIRLGNLKDVRKESVEHGSLSWVAIGECLVPDIDRPSSGSQMLKSPKIMPTPLGCAGQCG